MPEAAAPATPAPSVPFAPVTVPAPAPLLAGKFADEAALSKGIQEARKAIGLTPFPDSVKIIGADGLFIDAKSAESEYKSYERQIGKPKEPAAPAVTPATPAVMPVLGGEPLADDAAPAQVLERAGLKQQDLIETWTKNGALTDEQYSKLKEADPRLSRLNAAQAKAIVNQEFRLNDAQSKLNQIAVNDAITSAHAIAGGKDKFDALILEAPKFVPASEREGLDLLVKNPKTLAMATRILMTMHADSVGAAGAKPVVGGQPGGGQPQITTTAEYLAVEKRAVAGDKGAQATILAMTNHHNLK